MFTRICAVSLFVLALTLVVAMPGLAADATKGKVVSTDNNKLTVSDGAKDHVFDVTADTKITIKGNDGKLSDLKAGDEVTITAEKDGDKMVAKTIVSG